MKMIFKVYFFHFFLAPDNEWVLGIPFLKNVYSVFDLGEIQVGLGQLA
jgi:hypothetical protein